jgi:hypothetical protein
VLLTAGIDLVYRAFAASGIDLLEFVLMIEVLNNEHGIVIRGCNKFLPGRIGGTKSSQASMLAPARSCSPVVPTRGWPQAALVSGRNPPGPTLLRKFSW